MSDLLKFNISEILRGLSNRDFSTTELVESYLQQINKTKKLNMYLEITSEQSLKTAKESDHKYKNKTISVKLKKNNKEKDIIQLLNSFDKMDVKDIQTKLKSKGVNTKKNNKNKLLKYIYLLTCVDDNINVIKN